MKYRVLLKFLQVLVYAKRLFWRIGSGVYYILGAVVGTFTRFLLYIRLRIGFFLKRIGVTQSNEWVLKRDFLQIVVFFVLLFLTFEQSKLAGKQDLSYVGQKTLAYALLGGSDEFEVEEVHAQTHQIGPSSYSWKTGAIAIGEMRAGDDLAEEQYVPGAVIVGGSAIGRPTLMPGTVASASRTDVVDYTIQQGDTLSSIAYEYGISVSTIMWENGLTVRSILRPGVVLKIPPTTGVMHTIKKGDTLAKIASAYGAKVEDIVNFNHLNENGSDLKVGERIAVPNGARQSIAVATTKKPLTTQTSIRRPAPPNSLALPSISGFVWPSAARIITQYYGLKHHALDIAGKWQSAIYAAKSGTVAVSQCGWNSGYGCYIIIDHGDGVRSLYGHNSQLLVSVGDYVETGQTIALMGNTGKVRGVTGIHSHFEIQVKGIRVNPLKYVR